MLNSNFILITYFLLGTNIKVALFHSLFSLLMKPYTKMMLLSNNKGSHNWLILLDYSICKSTYTFRVFEINEYISNTQETMQSMF